MHWKVVANRLCVVVHKPNGMDDIICIWELDDGLNMHFISQKQKGLLIMNNYATHSLMHVGRDRIIWIVNLEVDQ
jgi:hypothetical protein